MSSKPTRASLHSPKTLIITLLLGALLLCFNVNLSAQPALDSIKLQAESLITDSTATDSLQNVTPQGVPVIFTGDTLFSIYSSIGPFDPSLRSLSVMQRLNSILKSPLNPDSIRTVNLEGYSNIVLGTQVIMSVTTRDASFIGKTTAQATEEYAEIIKQALISGRTLSEPKIVLTKIGIALLLILLAVLAFWGIAAIFPKLYSMTRTQIDKLIKPVHFKSRVIISSHVFAVLSIGALKLFRLFLSLAILYAMVLTTWNFFPWAKSYELKSLVMSLLFAVLATVVVIVAIKTILALFKKMLNRVDHWDENLFKTLKFKTIEIISQDRLMDIARSILKILNIVVLLGIVYAYLAVIFSFFDFTKTWAATLIQYILSPLEKVVISFVQYLPNLFFVVVIIIAVKYLLKLIHLIFDEIEKGTITLPGFFPEWAQSTYKIVRFLLSAFALVIVFPYLPGSGSPAFQGVSIFIGVLFSLGSTSVIANMVAGLVITYMRPFKIGDRVEIGSTVGDVIEKTLLSTRLRTIKNVDVNIPNSVVLGSHIINFSSSASDRGLILHTSVTIGYDAPWRQVHELLLSAAAATEHILKDPPPFIFQTSLDDFYVSYELNAYTNEANIMAKIYSDLHQNIQDKFNEGGVEIMSPHYGAMRDGNQTTIPENYLPKDYRAPSFRIVNPFRKEDGNTEEGNK
ncbi:MAG: mechanosensitive ion channel [bacterium]|nr:mechanosensitive ion channel [bacterium]